MGVETLIIFIAMILVAAVAAAVIIRTSGVLQERAFAVSGQTRKRLVTGLEVIEMLGESNTTAHTIANIEFSIRLRSGSTPINLRTTQMTFNTQDLALTARLQNTLNEEYNISLTNLNNTLWQYLNNDLDEDGLNDYMRLGVNCTGANECIEFNLTTVGILNVSLGKDLETPPVENISLNSVPVTKNGDIYGYSVTKSPNNQSAKNSLNTTLNITQFPKDNVCNYQTVIPERYYCIVARLGNKDSVLEYGEVYIMKFRLKESNALKEEDTFQINIIPKEGSITYLAGSIPDVINDRKLILWPA